MIQDSGIAAAATTISWALKHNLKNAYWCFYPLACRQEDSIWFIFICKYLSDTDQGSRPSLIKKFRQGFIGAPAAAEGSENK